MKQPINIHLLQEEAGQQAVIYECRQWDIKNIWLYLFCTFCTTANSELSRNVVTTSSRTRTGGRVTRHFSFFCLYGFVLSFFDSLVTCLVLWYELWKAEALAGWALSDLLVSINIHPPSTPHRCIVVISFFGITKTLIYCTFKYFNRPYFPQHEINWHEIVTSLYCKVFSSFYTFQSLNFLKKRTTTKKNFSKNKTLRLHSLTAYGI